MVMAVAGAAHAGGQASTIGVGAEFQLSGAGGASVNYDGGPWHAGAFFGFADRGRNSDADFVFGGQFYYHLHSTAMSDFGVGGSIGIVSDGDAGPRNDQRDTLVYIEPGIQIRLFLASNVAFSASTGIVIGQGDADGVGITGSTIGGGTVSVTNGGTAIGFTGGLGLHYYFF